jgi:outer membrane protein TolC
MNRKPDMCVTYFEVIDPQRAVLALERVSAQLAAQRLTNGVALINSPGGGWRRAPATLAVRS